MNKLDLALNNLQRLICHKTKPDQTKLVSKLSYLKTISLHTHIHIHVYSFRQ